MTDAANPQPASAGEAQVEDAVRDILGSLDRRLGQIPVAMGLSFVVGCPAVVLLLRFVFHLTWGASLPAAFLVLLAVIVLGVGLADWLARRAAARFLERFPAGSLQRTLALGVLAQLEYPSRAPAMLQQALEAAGIRRPPGPPVEHQLQAALDPPGGTPAQPPPPAPAGPAPPGGYYDYVPLDLPAREQPKDRRP
jgi:hypothetical protein